MCDTTHLRHAELRSLDRVEPDEETVTPPSTTTKMFALSPNHRVNWSRTRPWRSATGIWSIERTSMRAVRLPRRAVVVSVVTYPYRLLRCDITVDGSAAPPRRGYRAAGSTS